MSQFLVIYDLMRPGQNYPALFSALRSLGAKEIQYSAWVLRSGSAAFHLATSLRAYIDANDRLFVTQMSGWAEVNSINNPNHI
jgi:hypothetical protein